jgi:putative endonuclease
MKTEKQLQGLAGEDMAVNLLLQKGYKIIERNWRCGHLEVDIIAENEGYLVIVEVKTRKNAIFGSPEVFVDKQKQRHLIRAAMYYAKFKHITKEIRFDIISVINSPELQEVNHIENAFKPKW